MTTRPTLPLIALAALLSASCASTAEPTSFRGSPYILDADPPVSQCNPDDPAQQWAVVVGVNFYQDDRIPDLDGAVNDAWSFYHFLASPHGAAINPYRLKLLLNDQATRTNIEGALGNFLASACPQDQVIIFFAGHGTPEPDRPEDAFLLVHDSQLDNIVGSAISMQRLPDFLEWRAGQAGKLLMFIDACHSGNISFGGKRGVKKGDDKTRANAVLGSINKLVEGKEGWGAMTATAPDQLAGESKTSCLLGGKSYPGGVFTCHIMEGLAGSADTDKSGDVTLGELFGHVEKTVGGDSGGAQVPQLSGSLDQGMSLAKYRDGNVAIPMVPKRYTIEGDPHPYRDWIFVGAGLTVAAAGAAAYFNIVANDRAADTDAGVAQESGIAKATYDSNKADYDLYSSLTVAGYAATGAFALGTLALAGLDIFLSPEDIGDVYFDPPWFELGIAPTPEGGSMNLLFNY